MFSSILNILYNVSHPIFYMYCLQLTNSSLLSAHLVQSYNFTTYLTSVGFNCTINLLSRFRNLVGSLTISYISVTKWDISALLYQNQQ